jgi:hypothetical protein
MHASARLRAGLSATPTNSRADQSLRRVSFVAPPSESAACRTVYACRVVFIRKKDEEASLPLAILGLLVIAFLALATAVWLTIDVEGNLLSPITEGRKAGLPIAVFIVPLGALGFGIIGCFVWITVVMGREEVGRPVKRRRAGRTR